MGTTIVAAIAVDRKLYVTNVGDSRLYLLEEEQLTADSLYAALDALWENKDSYIEAMNTSPMGNSIQIIADLLDELASQK